MSLKKIITLLLVFFYISILKTSAQSVDFRMGPVIGGVQSNESRIFAAASQSGIFVIAYDTVTPLSNPNFLSVASVENPFNRLFFNLEDLEAKTTYYFSIYRENTPTDTIHGSFLTFPEDEDVLDFNFTFGSCMKGSSVDDIFENMALNNPAFFLHLGDYTYPDGKYNRDAYLQNDTLIDSSYIDRYTYDGMTSFLKNTPIDYIYDDHDYTRNNSGKTTYSRDSIYQGSNGIENFLWESNLLPGVRRKAIESYVKYFPGYELPDTSEGIYHSFRHGQVEVFFIDNRSSRTPSLNAFEFNPQGGITPWAINPPANHSILGTEQMNWLLNKLENSDATWKFIVSGVTFNRSLKRLIDFGLAVQWLTLDVADRSGSGLSLSAGFSDGWAGFSADQNRLINFIRNNNLENVILLTGDTHTSAMDDGTNSGLPEFNSSCLQVNESVIGLYAIADSVGQILGQPTVKDSLWNKGASGLNNVNTLPGFGRVEVFGNDSVRLCQVDKFGEVTYCWTVPAGFKSPTSISYLDKIMNNPFIHIYPNPVSKFLQAEFMVEVDEIQQISWQIIDMLGKKHLSGTENQTIPTDNKILFTVDAGNLKTGFYFLMITSEKEPISKMFFKN